MNKIKFSIVTPEKTVYESEIDSVRIPTQMGEVGILPNHIPLVSAISPGELLINKEGNEYSMLVAGGFLEIRRGSEVIVLADAAERAEEIDIERAEAARKRAKEIIEQKHQMEDVQFAAAQAALERSLARLKVARKRR